MKELLILEPNRVDTNYLKDLFRYKDLFLFFTKRDILVRYRQAFFGIAWALTRPLLTMAIFALIFGKLARLPSEGVNYGLFVLAGMIPWLLFANATLDGCNCLLNNAHLITKTYFPRMIIPASQLMVHLVDYGVNMVFMLSLVLFMVGFSFNIISIFLFFFLLVSLCLGLGLWFSSLTVRYRDFKILIPFILQFGMFISPVAYGTFMIPERFQWFYFLNPLVGIIDGYRWAFFGVSYPLLGYSILFSTVISLTLLVSGFYYFRQTERTFADKL